MPLPEKFWEVLEPSSKKVLTSLVIGLLTTYLTDKPQFTKKPRAQIGRVVWLILYEGAITVTVVAVVVVVRGSLLGVVLFRLLFGLAAKLLGTLLVLLIAFLLLLFGNAKKVLVSNVGHFHGGLELVALYH